MIKICNGDIFNCEENIIVHQVNCQGVMGLGVAKRIKQEYFEVYNKYKVVCSQFKSNELLGKCQIIKTKNKYICNLFGQEYYGRGSRVYTDYKAFKTALNSMKKYAKENGLSVALPYGIGCGLANGSWDIVYAIIEEVFEDYSCTLYKYSS